MSIETSEVKHVRLVGGRYDGHEVRVPVTADKLSVYERLDTRQVMARARMSEDSVSGDCYAYRLVGENVAVPEVLGPA